MKAVWSPGISCAKRPPGAKVASSTVVGQIVRAGPVSPCDVPLNRRVVTPSPAIVGIAAAGRF